MHFAYLLKGIEQMIQTSQPTWPVERTLLTSGTTAAGLRSLAENGKRQETPHLAVKYQVGRESVFWRE